VEIDALSGKLVKKNPEREREKKGRVLTWLVVRVGRLETALLEEYQGLGRLRGFNPEVKEVGCF
jgi:hypothetical protein